MIYVRTFIQNAVYIFGLNYLNHIIFKEFYPDSNEVFQRILISIKFFRIKFNLIKKFRNMETHYARGFNTEFQF